MQGIKAPPYRNVQLKTRLRFSKVIIIYFSQAFLLLPMSVTTEHMLQQWSDPTVSGCSLRIRKNVILLSFLPFLFQTVSIRDWEYIFA